MWYLYLARCKDKTIYVGVTKNVVERLDCHNTGSGSLWIKQHGPARVVYKEAFDDYRSARRRETQVKKWSRIKKEKLVTGSL